MAQSVERQTVNLQVPGSRVHESPGEGDLFAFCCLSSAVSMIAGVWNRLANM